MVIRGCVAFPRSVMLCLSVLAFSVSALAQFEARGTFTALSNYATISVAVGDFNHDGHLDLAVVSYCCPGSGVSILLGNGDGTFRSPVSYAAGEQPWTIVAVDLNHDGNLDLAVADSLSNYVSILLGNGDGSFQKATRSPTLPRYPTMLKSGDFNGDGIPDLVAASYSVISVLLGNGDGTFQAPVNTEPPFGVESIGLGDFNRDGKLDLVEAGTFGSGGNLNILLGNGNGTFRSGASYPVGQSPESIAVADFSSDHKLDLAVANSEGGSVSVLLGNGDGTFQAPVNYPIAFCVWVTSADVNGDGKLDLVAAADYDFPNVSGAAVFLGNGDGTFQTPAYYPGNWPDEGYAGVGDFNGDGKPDLVLTNFHGNDVLVMLNTGVVNFSPTTPLAFKKQAIGTTSVPQTVTLTNTGATELKMSSMKASAQFGVSSTCGSSVAAGANCTISVTFSPKTQGAKSGTVTINDSASSKPQVIELSGTGT
jgi:hypothetical protein